MPTIPESFILVSIDSMGERITNIVKNTNELIDMIKDDLYTLSTIFGEHPQYNEWVNEIDSYDFVGSNNILNKSYYNGKLTIKSKGYTRTELIEDLIAFNYKNTATKYGPLLNGTYVSDRIINTMIKLIGYDLLST